MAGNWYFNIRKGAQGELLAALDLMDHGFEIFRAVDAVASTDLIAHKAGSSWRVQVKTGDPSVTEIKPGKQEIVAWVSLKTRTVRYDPGLPATVPPMRDSSRRTTAVHRENEERIAACLNVVGNDDAWKAQFRHEDNRFCDIRTVEIFVKEFSYDQPWCRGPFHCPNCKGALELQWVRNSKEFVEEEERRARASVNRQIYRRDRIAAGDQIVVYSGTELCNEELPQ